MAMKGRMGRPQAWPKTRKTTLGLWGDAQHRDAGTVEDQVPFITPSELQCVIAVYAHQSIQKWIQADLT